MALLVGSAMALASPITGVIYQNVGDPNNAGDLTLNTVSTLPNATFTVGPGGINFTSIVGLNNSANYTPASFLGITFTNENNGFDPNATLDNSEIVFTGTISLAAGVNSFTIEHDDGFIMTVTGATVSPAGDDPNPTAPTSTPFTITTGAAGDFAFTMDYSECCGAPAVLQIELPSGTPIGSSVPEPNTGLLMASGLMLGLLGFGVMKKKMGAEA